ncbi:hypothetical protein DR871_013765 [Flavobacterium petrolei]|uniref:Helix-turn-helix domain-containing protein n=1 Tax=Flavobacterium petrolei TaxID=2259594 RepID=A0A482THQ3_9FLAO|nr:hypothetical protein [Flavobacterium petrolei]RYJ50988.1 hypothetical protein DR871_013765 [Flavobacterium petrolei]
MITKKKYETEGLDNYLRLFPKVMRTELTLLQKYILCDVISRNIQGEPYYKVSNTLAEELGNYKKKTIQTAFQWLNTNGYINTEPYNDGKHKEDLREVELIQIEKWIYTDEHLNKIGFKILPTEKKTKDENYAWIMKNRKGNDVSKKNEHNLIIPESINASIVDIKLIQNEHEGDKDEITIGYTGCKAKVLSDDSHLNNGLITLKFDDLDYCANVGNIFINQIKNGQKFDFQMVNIDFEDGGIVLQEEVIKIPNSSKYYAKSSLKHIDNSLFSDEMD